MNVKVIAFDADDTLWINEPYFQETEKKFCALLEDYLPHHAVSQELFKTEMENLSLYGYGVKGFILSMVETAVRISDHTLDVTARCQDIASAEGITDKDILGAHKSSMLEYEHGPLMEYTPYTHNTRPLLYSLAELQPKTLATMHGSSFYGDCSQALKDLSVVMKEIWGNGDM